MANELQTIRNGLVATVVSYGKYAASEVSTCDFGLSTLTASCMILQPGPNNVFRPISFGSGAACGLSRDKSRSYDITGIVMIKDPGDAKTFLAKLWQACDDVYDSINHDDTLNGTACAAYVSTISRPSIDAFISDGNIDYGFINFSVTAEIF